MKLDNPPVKTRILLAEDEAVIALNIEDMLRMSGYHVAGIVSSGEEIITAVTGNPPDLLIVDIMLAGEIDGIDAVTAVLKDFDIPVIYLTAHSDKATLERAKATKPYGFIIKPINRSELYSTIEISLYKHKLEMQLKESEERFRTLFEKSANPILIINTQGEYLQANEAALNFLECSMEELSGKRIGDFMPPHLKKEEVLEKHHPLWERGGTIETEYWINGKLKVMELTISSAMLSGSRVIFGIGKDITERRKSDQELLRLRAAVNQAAEGIIMNDMDLNVIYANKSFGEMYGFDVHELQGKNFLEVYTMDHDLIKEITREIGEQGSWQGEMCHYQKDGTPFHVSMVCTQILDKNGNQYGFIAICRDISQKKKYEKILVEKEKLLRSISENYPDSYLSIIEKDLTIGYSSGQEFKKQNLDPRDFFGKTIEDVFGEKSAIVRKHYLRTFEGNEEIFELSINNQHQLYKTVPLYDENDEISRILVVVENITGKKESPN